MGVFGGSKRISNTISDTDVYNTQIGLEDIQGPAVLGDGNMVNVTHADFGAIDAARSAFGEAADFASDIGVEALRLGQANLDTASGLAGRGLDTAISATRAALDFSAGSVRANEAVARDAISNIADFGGVALGESLDFARDVVSGAGTAMADLTRANIEGLGSLARQTSASADDRVTRTAMYAFMALVAVFVLPRVLA